ncbi:hypothetical protein JTB14_002882 [Gonioctena quinquepunctata]|nr:hypothetical protein JTB14_002882 [Gonioctena quinquepunctata]
MSLHRTIFFNISTSGGQRKADWYPARHLNNAVFKTALEITEGNIKDLEQLISVVKNVQQLGIDKDTKGRDINQRNGGMKKLPPSRRIVAAPGGD